MQRVCVVSLLLAIGLLRAPAPLSAQDRAGTITGSVNDAGHYVLPGDVAGACR